MVSDIFICEGKDTFVALNCVTTLVFTEDIDRGITIKTRINGDQTRRSQGQAFFFRETSIINLQETHSLEQVVWFHKQTFWGPKRLHSTGIAHIGTISSGK